jgi:hypothetical protein
MVGSEEVETFEVAHEALLREWQELNNALEEERSFLVWLPRIESDANRCESLPANIRHTALLKGFALLEAEKWLGTKPHAIPAEPQAFIKISLDVDAYAGRSNRFYDRLSRIGAPVAVAFLALVPLAFLLYFCGPNRWDFQHERTNAQMS